MIVGVIYYNINRINIVTEHMCINNIYMLYLIISLQYFFTFSLNLLKHFLRKNCYVKCILFKYYSY